MSLSTHPAPVIPSLRDALSRLEEADYQGRSLSMLRRIASALNKQVEIRFVPAKSAS